MSDMSFGAILGSLTVGVIVFAVIVIRRFIEATRTPISPDDRTSGERFTNWFYKCLSIPSPSKTMLSAWEKDKEKK